MYMLDESICHLGVCRAYFVAFIHFGWQILLANTVDPDQTPHYVASDLGLHCLPMTFYGFPGENGLIGYKTGFSNSRMTQNM